MRGVQVPRQRPGGAQPWGADTRALWRVSGGALEAPGQRLGEGRCVWSWGRPGPAVCRKQGLLSSSRFFLAPSPPCPTPSTHPQHTGRKNRALDRNQSLGLNSVTTALCGQIPSDPWSPPL